jgi:iron complex outermembrane receptor protein
MNRRKGNYRRVHHYLAASAAAIAFVAGASCTAHAQAAPGRASAAVKIDIVRGELSKSLTQLGRQAGVQIAFLPDRVRGRHVDAVRGNLTVEQALDRLLAGTGLRYQRTPGGSYVVGGQGRETETEVRRAIEDINTSRGRDAEGRAVIPDILVVGNRNWNLNLDIPRTADDAQPYVVFNHEEIARSGATNLDDFFRNFLGANNSASTSAQTNVNKSQSVINLRGLGADATLILVDGRRYSQANTGSGVFSQSSVNGIPLESIERIEVLASSASGIYGSNAIGGVINIIMRRDYHGLAATAYYGNTSRFDAAEKRLSLNGSFPIENGRTRLSFTGSWQKTDGLVEGDRDFISAGRALILENQPNYLTANRILLQGATPNIISTNGSNLVLDNGTALGANTTFVPVGYRGVALDGVAPLIANAGRQNTDLSPTGVTGKIGNGQLSPLLSPSQSYSGSVTARREFSSWLSGYGEFGYSRYENSYLTNQAARTYTLAANAPDNPFTTSINVSVPGVGQDQVRTNVSTNMRALAGAIVKLPYGWQAALDFTWNWGSFNSGGLPPGFTKATEDGLNQGTIDILRDVAQYPIPYQYQDLPFSQLTTPSKSFSSSYTMKLAGPTPWLRLWGGKPIITLLLERDKQSMGDSITYLDSNTSSTVFYTPARSQRTDSAYGEVRLPIIGKDNHVPLIRELELQIAGRYDHYTAVGANTGITCVAAIAGPLPASAFTDPCPGSATPRFATTNNGSFNPTVALRWAVVRDLALRGSYSTGYQPPYLNAVIKTDAAGNGALVGLEGGVTAINVTDPARGNEAIGTSFFTLKVINASLGGNPDVDPQTSKTWSFGAILTPRLVPGLRLSADWTRITINNLYFAPFTLLTSGTVVGGQQAFNDFLAAHPERFTRAAPAPGDPYQVGKIIFIDASTANLSRSRSESVDFAGSYTTKLGNGRLDLQANATWLRNLSLLATPSSKLVNSTGVVSNQFMLSLGGQGGVEWKGNGSIVYSTDRWSLGWRVRYVGSYWLNVDHSVLAIQGAAKMGAQSYSDIFGSFKITPKTELRAGINNIFDRRPPISATQGSFYSQFGDPRRMNFYLSINRKL